MNPIGIGLAIAGGLLAMVGVASAVKGAEAKGVSGEQARVKVEAEAAEAKRVEIDSAVAAERDRVLTEQARASVAAAKQTGAN